MSAAANIPLPFDAELLVGIQALQQAFPQLADETLDEYRRLLASFPQTDLSAGGAVHVEERTVPGAPNGPDITVLILRPATGTGPWPGIYFIHGGGMVFGDRRSGVDMFLPLVATGKAVVVSVEYRLAPEHPHPAPVEDCYAALTWTAWNSVELQIDPGRLMIAGFSAGGGLAAGTALMARDRRYPQLSQQVLISPMLDDRCKTPSSQMLDRQGTWDRNDNLYGWTALLGDHTGRDDVSYYAAPARCLDLSGLPRTYIETGSAETFRDEALDFAIRLSQAGVLVDLHMWGGGNHGFDLCAPNASISRAAVATRSEFLNRVLS